MANKPYPFSVCKECAGGGSGGGDIDLSGYVEKIDGYGLTSIMEVEDFDISVVGGQSKKKWKEIWVNLDGEDYSVAIPAYTSDLEDDIGIITSKNLKTEIEKIFPNGDEVSY